MLQMQSYRSWNRDCIDQKAKNVYYLALYRKNLPTWVRARSPELKGPGSYSSSLLHSSERLGNLITLSVLQFPLSQTGIIKRAYIMGFWKCTALTTVSGMHCGKHSRVGCCFLASLHPLLSSVSLLLFPKWQKSQSTAPVLPFLTFLCLLNPLPHPTPSATPQDLLDVRTRPSTYPNPPSSRISISSYFSVASDTVDHIPLRDGLPPWEYPSKLMVWLLQLL